MDRDPQEVMEPEPVAQESRSSGRIHQEPERYEILISDNQSVVLVDQDEPTTYHEAIESPNSTKWLEAVEDEMNLMYNNKVWTFFDPPEGAKIIEGKRIIKLKADNTF